MPTHVDRDEVVGLLRRQFGAIGQLAESVGADQWDVATCLPGWTVRDVLSHMTGTEMMLSGHSPPTVDVTDRGPFKNPVAEANEVWVESMRGLAGTELTARWNEVSRVRLAELDAMSQADFDAPSWTPAGRDETYGRFMRIRHYDCFMHEQDMRFALGRAERAEPDSLAPCLDEVATGLGYIVGRRAAMPDGSRVQIDLTGPVTRTFRIRVDGRADVVDSLDGPPTVGLGLPVTLFLRLTGGRDDRGSGPPGDVRLSGDEELAQRLRDNLAFTI
ncbi:MAG TPA: maleylpyruvate isomerase family mycothiol-dependent enzyme [Acidimicrobiales bacterium]|jgi:uncharacterized protein (TIGR03083 family)|nr:maleylpyruvate isomerase family mycothiol-dependent enzyme [Acidimicrobiales bacterium]